jgi:hypothetical protein
VTVAAELSYLGGLLKVARAVWRLEVPRDAVADAREGLKLVGAVGKSQQRDRVPTPEELARVKALLAQPAARSRWSTSRWRRPCGSVGDSSGLRWDDLGPDNGETVLIVRDRKDPQFKDRQRP